jgi:hypothetical protein
LFAHIQACHNYGEDSLTLMNEFRHIPPSVGLEEINESVHTLTRSHSIEEMPNLLLKQDDNGYSTHAYQLIKDATHQLHLQNFADNNPQTDKEQHSIKDIYRARLLHELIAIVKTYGHKQNINQVLYTKF